MKCGYCGWIMVGCNIEQHKCFEKYKEDIHLLHSDENHVARIIPRYGHKNLEINTTDVVVPVETKSDDTDETLIELVFERPALWNHKLPLQDRTNLKKDALWLEVSNRMGGGNATVKWVKNRWKDLRDAYVKARKKMKAYVPSGSDTASAKKLRQTSFRFFERMQFLEITLATETTINSLPSEPASLPSMSASDSNSLFDSSCSDSIINLDVSSLETSQQLTTSKMTHNKPISAFFLSNTVASKANSPSVSKNKRKRFDNTENEKKIQESLLEALCQPLKQPDAIDGILLRLGEGLRRLSYGERTKLEIQWLRELMAAEEQCSNN